MQPPSTQGYRDAVARFATGVTLLTTRVGEVHQGLTANTFTSVSLDPLLTLVCVQRTARFHAAILRSGVWAVSVLGAEQEDVARTFAVHGRPYSARQFDPYPHSFGKVNGCVLLDGALAVFECRTRAVYPAGDHSIIVGEVQSAQVGGAGRMPLLYLDRAYTSATPG